MDVFLIKYLFKYKIYYVVAYEKYYLTIVSARKIFFNIKQ